MKKILLLFFCSLIGFSSLMAQTYCFTSPQGYAAGVTGGGNASPVTVTNQADLKSALTASGNGVILVSGTISCSYMSLVITNKTLLGLPGAKLRNLDQTKAGSGIINIKGGSNNVIIRNLIFEGPGAYDTDGRDLMTLEDATKIWIDHCEFQDGMDGNLDHKGSTDNTTISWCKFTYLKAPKPGGSGGTDDHRFSNLVGSSDSDKPSDGKYSITWQYCWWAQGCVERMTRARNAQLDIVNCYWNSSVAKVALGLGGVTDCYVQNSVFANSGDKYRYYNNGTVRLTTVGSTNPPSNVGTCPPPSHTREAIPASSVVSAVTGSCGAGATLNVSSSGAVSANSSCGGGNLNEAPSVSITSPANNATFTAPASITINATAADADGTVSKVEFYNGNTLIGSDASSPYSYSWTNVAGGTYTITAKATDDDGAVTTSTAIIITVSAVNQPPAVSITSPANNETFTAPANVTINATATDGDGTVSKVDFYHGNTLIGTDASSPYSYSWTNVAAGTYTITAKATDNNGAVTTSAAILVVVNPAGQPPVVSITSPANNATFNAPANISLEAATSDADGTVAKVEFYSGATLLGTDLSSPYNFSWTNVPAGSYSVVAKATDNSGIVATSAAITLIVYGAPGSDVTIQAETACDIAGIVETKNAGFNGDSYVNVDNAVGSTITWSVNSLVSQTVNLTLRYAATSDRNMSLAVNGAMQVPVVSLPSTGSFTTWNTSTVQVVLTAGTNKIVAASLVADGGPNIDELTFSSGDIGAGACSEVPTVSITSPSGNANYDAPASVTVEVNAGDSDGTIAKVDFYNGTTLLGTDANAPYSFTWNNIPAGAYSITAVATDNSGAMKVSAPVAISVNVISSLVPVTGYETFTNVYPNPSNNIFTVDCDQDVASVYVLNLYGEKVEELNNLQGGKLEIGRELPGGIYMLIVEYNSQKREMAKIIKAE